MPCRLCTCISYCCAVDHSAVFINLTPEYFFFFYFTIFSSRHFAATPRPPRVGGTRCERSPGPGTRSRHCDGTGRSGRRRAKVFIMYTQRRARRGSTLRRRISARFRTTRGENVLQYYYRRNPERLNSAKLPVIAISARHRSARRSVVKADPPTSPPSPAQSFRIHISTVRVTGYVDGPFSFFFFSHVSRIRREMNSSQTCVRRDFSFVLRRFYSEASETRFGRKYYCYTFNDYRNGHIFSVNFWRLFRSHGELTFRTGSSTACENRYRWSDVVVTSDRVKLVIIARLLLRVLVRMSDARSSGVQKDDCADATTTRHS